ncbi:MAG TPA: TIGR03619 family F420-dependent LLM class oxidoreductase [Acidimicrobiales bacterium]|nr:TIGR03619 family F420-dependent LLM class oxidoreductase [Acidimicrobiales bacterium]
MRLGVHLPQYGRAAGPEAIARVARHAEDLGFDDVWVSDHIAIPDGAPYPPSFLYEPLQALAWAAAATTRVGLGTSVIILPYRHPLHLAKELASLDQLSDGRVVLGAGAGWLEGEFEALGVPFAERGPRTDEAIDVLRACWEGEEPVSFAGPTVELRRMKVRPRPAHRIPVWIGGSGPPALRRALERGDGWHGNLPPDRATPILRRLRERRPDDSFVLSMRTAWEGLSTPADDIRRQADVFAAEGVQHVVATPGQPDLDGWLRSVEALREVLKPYR